MGRLHFFAALFVLGLVASLVSAPVYLSSSIVSEAGDSHLVLVSSLVVFSVPQSALVAQRAHDLGVAAAVSLPLFLALIASILTIPSQASLLGAITLGGLSWALLLLPGSKVRNRFGEPPLY